MAEIVVRDRASFAAWLERKPAAVSQVLAMRSALRATPLLLEKTQAFEKIQDLISFSFRAHIISWTAQCYPTKDIENAAYSASFARSSSAFSNFSLAESTSSAAYAASSAAYAVSASASTSAATAFAAAVSAAAYAAAAAAAFSDYRIRPNNFWENIRADIDWISNNTGIAQLKSLAFQPLFLERSYTYEAVWREFNEDLLGQNRNFRVWIDWYQRRLRGGETGFHLPEDIDRLIMSSISSEKPEFWDLNLNDINAEIIKRQQNAQDEVDRRNGLPTEKDLPQQDQSTTAFVALSDGKLGLAPVRSEYGLMETPAAVTQYQEIIISLRSLSQRSVNEIGGSLSALILHLEGVLAADLWQVDSHALWSRANRLRRVLYKHLAAVESKDYSPDRLDFAVAQDLSDFIANYNIFVLMQPVLVAKDSQARGPVDPVVEGHAFGRLRSFIVAVPAELATPDAAEVVQAAVADAEAPGAEIVTELNRIEARKVQTNFVAAFLHRLWAVTKDSRKALHDGAGKELGSQIFRLAAQHRLEIIGFIGVVVPACVEAVKKLFGLIP